MEDKLPDALKKSLMPIITEAFEYDQVWYPPMVAPHALDKLKTFEVREDDLILASYPKSGTHWMMELMLLIQQNGRLENVKRHVCLNREFTYALPPDFKTCAVDLLVTCPSPRFYRTHLPCQHLPPQVWKKKSKVVYVTREPKDCCASNYRFLNSHPAESSEVPWEMYFNNFISEKVRFGNWCDHGLGYWKHRMGGHVFFVTYEEMKQDVRSVTRRLAKFLGKNISSDGMERIVEHSSFDGMRRTYAQIEEKTNNGKMFTRFFGVIPHLQQGRSGSWKVLFSEDQKEKMDDIMLTRLAGTGLDVYYPYVRE